MPAQSPFQTDSHRTQKDEQNIQITERSALNLGILVACYKGTLFRASRGVLALPHLGLCNITGEELMIQEQIGRGIFGDVFQARHCATGLHVALKEFRKSFLPNISEAIIEDIKRLSKLRSPHVVKPLGILNNERCSYLIVEYVERRSLQSLVRTSSLWEEIVAAIAYQVLRGMKYLDDIKPSNILFESSGLVRLFDFGFCPSLIASLSGTQIDSLRFMAPERVLADTATHYDERSDVWTLGSLVYFMIKGHAVYSAEEYPVFYHHVLACSAGIPPRLPLCDFSPTCIEFLSKCLCQNAADRATFDGLLKLPFIASLNVDKAATIVAHFMN